jgi:hypothetical protein
MIKVGFNPFLHFHSFFVVFFHSSIQKFVFVILLINLWLEVITYLSEIDVEWTTNDLFALCCVVSSKSSILIVSYPSVQLDCVAAIGICGEGMLTLCCSYYCCCCYCCSRFYCLSNWDDCSIFQSLLLQIFCIWHLEAISSETQILLLCQHCVHSSVVYLLHPIP